MACAHQHRTGFVKRFLLITVSLLLLLPLVALSWLTATESGLHWISQHLISALPGTLTLSSLKGSLAGTIIVQDIRYQQDELRVYQFDSYLEIAGICTYPENREGDK